MYPPSRGKAAGPALSLFQHFSERLAGRTVTALGRRAKYLTAHLDAGPVLICHLGMSGSFRVECDGQPELRGALLHHERSKDPAHDHVVFHILSKAGQRSRIVFNDPRRFGFMLFAEEGQLDRHPMLANLGIEPTGNAFDGALLGHLLKGRKAPLKAALLDQTLIAGLGNIYASEALWRAGLSPRRPARTLASAQGKATARSERLAQAVRNVIAEAIEAGGSSLRDHVRTDGSLGYFQHSFSVYDREGEPCSRPGCSGTIRRIAQSGRSTFYCPVCQR